jgi:polysaccharide biosynthesis transport protein
MSRNYELVRSIRNRLEPLQPMFTRDHRPARLGQAKLPATQINKSDWRRTLNILQWHWRSSASFAAVVFLTVTFVAFTQKPLYEPTATIEIDPPGTELGSWEAGAVSNDTEYLETQAKKLESDELLVAVIRSLHLDQNPDVVGGGREFGGVSLFSRLNLFDWDVKPQEDSEAQLGEQTAVAPKLSKMENVTLRSLRSRVTITRDTSSRLVSARFSSHDPRLAALVTNTLVNLFIERSYKTRHDAVMQSSAWLSKQLDDVRESMKTSDAALVDYEMASGIAQLGVDDKQQSTFTQEVAELDRQLTQAQADRIRLEAYVNGIQAGKGASLQQVGNDPVIQGLTQKVAALRTALAESLVVYGKNHPNVRKIQNQTDELEAQLTAQRRAIIKGIQNSYAAAQEREKLLSQEMKEAMDRVHHMGQYNILKKEAQANRELYNTLYTRVKQVGISAESKASNIWVVDPARVLDTPTRPHRMLIMTIGLFVGLLGGAMIVLLKDSFAPTIRNLDDVKRSTGISAISIMPTFESKNGSGGAPGPDFTLLRDKENCQTTAAQRFVWKRPRSPEAEALRGLQTSIMLCPLGSPPQVIQIVSAFPGEGKTTLAVNLAAALSRHSKTCLVDADLRKPGIADSFGILPQQGLGEVLMGRASLKAVLTHLPDLRNLSILPACVPTGDPGQLFVSQSMQEILRALRQEFQHVVIDSPPLIAYADGRAIAPLADGLVLVGRYGFTTCEAMARSIELLTHVNAAPIIEVVLNAVGHTSLASRYP